jgi:hypothetical protein
LIDRPIRHPRHARGGRAWSRVAAIVVALGAVWALAGVTPARAAKATKKKSPHKPAAAAPDAATIAAKDHFVAAQKLYDLGKFEAALAEYDAAYSAKPLPALLFNIAQCHRNLGRKERAVFFFRRYLELSPAAKNRADVEASIAELEADLRDEEEAAAAAAAAKRAALAPPPVPPPPVSASLVRASDAAADTGVRPERHPVTGRWWFWTGIVVVALAAGGGVGGWYWFYGRDVPDDVLDHR